MAKTGAICSATIILSVCLKQFSFVQKLNNAVATKQVQHRISIFFAAVLNAPIWLQQVIWMTTSIPFWTNAHVSLSTKNVAGIPCYAWVELLLLTASKSMHIGLKLQQL